MTKVDPRLPRYQQIRDDIAARIAKGEWRAGDAIATEAELSSSYGVAIGTVRRAVDELANDGLIERAHGRGMFVRRADFSTSLFRFFRLGTGDSRPVIPESRILSRSLETPSVETRAKLGLGRKDNAVRMIRLRMDEGRVLLREEIWLSARLFGPILDMEVEQLMPLLYPAYEQHFGRIVARARERLRVETASPDIALDLGAATGAMVVRMERLAIDHADMPLEWRISHGLADQFVYEVDVH
ncbi:GntR family transcriptional regulator [Sphingomonas bisphenolicum]|uniref:GntR family transcriptional regulator n=1 Tax=Sphingomonas bisphenolicum TaxID=296544 RepID=A0ABN5WIR2_9SPHN|nr:GntR family transcriptional regulator [Sphingomonas bisphenolicum]BBF69808.1 GntR family transcriptional regulator [Sphingomonas bisphenolicum]